ncbi:MAG TPA: redoxin domain-containing protein [Dinghuibacter sp.]|uniref:redoxin domain-containing protein n=1 Tax=Dinghuibacter sp. TaxID=2024697 RepID=UPI002CE79A54|nr:redoxin domain-containing protein [Dinghuibacter sp.]HTJ10877.1 redoxin domain-containing protein [Dinghuibacter sp.]
MKATSIALVLLTALSARAQHVDILTNQVGYETYGPKRAVIQSDAPATVTAYRVVDVATGKAVFQGVPRYVGPVDHWQHRLFWTIDFGKFSAAGTYRLEAGPAASHPFRIGSSVLESATISDVIYYFKGQRCSGLLDAADRRLPDPLDTTRTIDLHGGWYDATGDYGKHLSHLSFSAYFNPQQISFTAWTLMRTWQLLSDKKGTDYRQYNRRLLDEALYGADYLYRCHVSGASFYRSVGAPGPGKLPQDRRIQPEEHSYRIKATASQSWGGSAAASSPLAYQSSFRSGGGLAIAALALASTAPADGEFTRAQYLAAASEAFDFLDKHNVGLTSDGQENILDDYCALMAATELYRVTHDLRFADAAHARATRLLDRLTNAGYWRADDRDRPFFHPADAGLPVVSLLNYYPVADAGMQTQIKNAVRRSLEYELRLTHAVTNPFGYSRQLVQDTLGNRRTAFFFPHGSEASPWWQGEDARLGSMATAARMAAPLYERSFGDSLETFAVDQLNWILGDNPFDASLLQGTGYHNPVYGFFGTFEYTNAPGGIVNGITSGLDDERDIALNIPYAVTHKDYDWRWAEQWLPHASWYLLAVASRPPGVDPEHRDDHPTLAIGAPAPDFSLPGIDGRRYSLASFRAAPVLMIVFMCNHCPTSQAYEKRIIRLTDDYRSRGVQVVAINPNDPASVRLDELGYSDLGDSYPEMKTRARAAGYNFPYLYDGDKEVAAHAYGPVSTPHVFIFDASRRLRYEGRIDDTEDPAKTPAHNDARDAIDALLAGRAIAVTDTKTFGCSIKWKEKTVWKQRAAIAWAHEPVTLDTIGIPGIRRLSAGGGDKLTLINCWATWCIPCVREFGDLVTLNRLYRDRGFQLVSISTDDSAHAGAALSFLTAHESSSPNYRFTGTPYALIEALDPSWKGALPYTMLVEPGGKVVYAHQGMIDYEEVKRIIFDDPYMGRIYR